VFEIILFGLVLFCGLIILLCKYVLKGVPSGSSKVQYLSEYENEPWFLDYARSFFPVLLLVFILRGFIAEPFRIPSGSMLPTLEVGDFILVNKFSYGIRLPILHKKIVPIDTPKRGQIMVFRYPGDDKTNYIKRVIGLPGDEIEYRHKRLYVNGQAIDAIANGTYKPFGRNRPINRYLQRIPVSQNSAGNGDAGVSEYSILLEKRSSSPTKTWLVPEGHYFALGDNRDHSLDSRFWGFVPDENIVGKAFFIWFHWNSNKGGGVKLSRVGEDI